MKYIDKHFISHYYFPRVIHLRSFESISIYRYPHYLMHRYIGGGLSSSQWRRRIKERELLLEINIYSLFLLFTVFFFSFGNTREYLFVLLSMQLSLVFSVISEFIVIFLNSSFEISHTLV